MKVLALAQDRLKMFEDLRGFGYFFAEPEINLELIDGNKQLKKLSDSGRHELLETASQELAKLTDWTPESIQSYLNKLLEITGQKPGILFSLIRIAVTWAPFSPQLNDTLALIGCERTLARLQSFLNIN